MKHRFGFGLAMLFGLAAVPAAAQVDLHGFAEAVTGAQLNDRDESLSEFTIRETRLQLKGDLYGDVGESHFKLDFLSDQVSDTTDLSIREGYVKFTTLANKLEVRVGRQPTTWGTGDLLFINDLFPKDWVSFFIGRDDEYLKAPSDAIRLGLFDVFPFTVDFVYTPEFTPDRTPTGERLELWMPDRVPGAPSDPVVRPRETLDNGEFAMRLNRYFGSWNAAAYGYVGFWKAPQGALPDPGGQGISQFYHPELNVWGGSLRGPFFGGVAWAEGAYYDSREDEEGMLDLLVPNSEIRAMAGFERQWWSDFTGGLQFYWEGMQDYDRTVAARQARIDQLVSGGADRDYLERQFYLEDENRTLLTLRLTQLFRYQTVHASFFGFYSPSDEDAYVRLALAYDYSDQLKLTVGANVFTGDDERTLFGMNEQNDNVYGRVRFSF